MFYVKFQFDYNIIPKGFTILPYMYLIWNIISLFLVSQYFLKEAKMYKDIYFIPDEFFITYNITKREKEIIIRIIKGYSYQQISKEFFISLGTVKNHIHNIYTKIGISDKENLRKKIYSFY